jgi:hypothetical protein
VSSSSNQFGSVAYFKVQVDYDIRVFEGQIDVDALEKWLNMLGYFSVQKKIVRENITFALLKDVPHVKNWWKTYYEKQFIEETQMFEAKSTWDCFMDVFKEEYYPIRNHDDQYTRWNPLHQERGQKVLKFKNTIHTLRTKPGIKEFKKYLVLKYRGALHKYI